MILTIPVIHHDAKKKQEISYTAGLVSIDVTTLENNLIISSEAEIVYILYKTCFASCDLSVH